MAKLPDLLELDDVGDVGDNRYRVHHPGVSPEGRDVVFGGQLLAQMIMASDKAGGSTKDIKSIHAIFARAGTYQSDIELQVDSLQAGRTWASDTVTAMQGDRLLSRALVLMSIDDPDLMRHSPSMPNVPGPDDATPAQGLAFPGGELRQLPDPVDGPGGVPSMNFWLRHPDKVGSVAANQAILSWATNGFLIGLGMRSHPEIDITQAHRTISTGVIGHTLNFHERIDVSEWLLVSQEATYTGRGRVHGRGEVFTQDGKLVATFSQDSMARKIEGELDPKRAM